MDLRPYQKDAVDNAISCIRDGESCLVVMATGTGKTVVIAHMLKELNPKRALVMAHREELIQQLSSTISSVTGEECCIEKADRWAKDLDNGGSRFVVATVQTLAAPWTDKKRMHRWSPDEFDLIVIDEAHHSAAKTYKDVVSHFNGPAVGYTATPKRGDDAALAQVFSEVAYVYSIKDAIDDGWLVPIRQQRVVVDSLDISGVRVSAGDLNGSQLAEALEQEKTIHSMVGPSIKIADGRQTLMFCASVAQAERAAEIWNRQSAGSAEVVTGTTNKDKRADIFRKFKTGEIQCITNVGVATEGTDLPSTAVVVMARPTKVTGLYQQMLGRGTRPLTGILNDAETVEERKKRIEESDKPFVDVVDFVGNSGRHKLITPFDILGGQFPQEVIDKAVEITQEDDVVEDPEAVLEEAERLLEEEREELQRALEREQQKIAEMRKKLRVEARYKSEDVDPFDLLDVPPQAVLPKSASTGRIRMASEKQTRMLLQNGIDPQGMTMAEATRLIGKIVQRSRKGLCSYKQMKLLRKYNIDAEMMTRAEASKEIDRIAKNGWKA